MQRFDEMTQGVEKTGIAISIRTSIQKKSRMNNGNNLHFNSIKVHSSAAIMPSSERPVHLFQLNNEWTSFKLDASSGLVRVYRNATSLVIQARQEASVFLLYLYVAS